MKVICKCCHKAFDYDMYMGLCPKCGRVYRRGKGHYSIVEKDMLGDFHVHVDEGGLNRGIHGVVYNQGTVSEKQILNSTSKATVNKEFRGRLLLESWRRAGAPSGYPRGRRGR